MRPQLLPISKAAPKVLFDASCRLVSVLRGLGEQLHDDRGKGDRDALNPLAWRDGVPRDMAMDPLHRITRGEGKTPCQHLVEGDTQ